MNADRTVLTDEMWARVAPLCPGKVTDPGCTAADNR
ncbi:MAG: IS5/IS1182 family transposase, partial [Rhodobacteraceae bacterium]|nr:IS5/IS1182 family transposase [Rhodospirillaceae bacterium]MCY4195619.1 IS5/IS1182 family transposase [Paracoccaceae bacterium]MCY4197737.1 IS5/IS1182 family transposase [Paracoccaceae bacterium]MCY4197796.1 IS5/IS1182 family transposase [Paracoccaceae bacterium]MCY4197919.1 IS5/IS1182 family transposase [Paracoccaceae bacterium]